jgi:hypothetical protein
MIYLISIEGHATRTKSITEDNHKEEILLAMERLNKAYTTRTGQNWDKEYTITTHFEDIDF